MGKESASAGTSASKALTSQNTVPAMITICRPEMERMWNRPELRMAWFTSSEMPARSPVISAAAISPRSPGSAAWMRTLISSRTRSIGAHKRRSSGATWSRVNGSIAPVASPVPPSRANQAVRPKSKPFGITGSGSGRKVAFTATASPVAALPAFSLRLTRTR